MSYKKLKEKVAKRRTERDNYYMNLAESLEYKYYAETLEDEKKLKLELDLERERQKIQAQKNHEAYLMERDRQQQLKNEAGTPKAKIREAKQQARENVSRDIAMGLTKEEIRVKYMDKKERIKYINKKNQKDIESKLSKIQSAISDLY